MAEQLTLLLRVAFVVLLYSFVWRVVRISVRDIRAPQDSMVIPASAAAAARSAHPPRGAAETPVATLARPRLLVLESATFPVGTLILLDEPVVLGRSPAADAVLDGDGFASARHARLEADGAGVIVEDLGSTNGTWVNGQRIAGPRVAGPGDEVTVGGTRMRIEAG